MKKRIAIIFVGLTTITAVVVGVVLGLGLFVQDSTAEAQGGPNARGGGNRDLDRLNQITRVLRNDPSPEAAEDAINGAMDILMGGIRPLPTKGLLGETQPLHDDMSVIEMKLAKTLEDFVHGGQSDEVKGLALQTKLLIEELNQVAETLSQATALCGEGDIVLQQGADSFSNPCSQLQGLLDEVTGKENEPVFNQSNLPGGGLQVGPLGASYSVNLRANIIPPRWSREIPEHVESTGPIAPDECAVVFKEFRGLLLQLHLERFTFVRDANDSTGLSGSTPVPVWVLQWVPAQFGKQWSMCNTGGNGTTPEITTTVTAQIVEDEGLLYFWRYYGNN